MSDYLQNLVEKSISAVQRGPSREVLELLAQLAELDPIILLPELFLQVEEAASGVDLNRLRPTDLIPDVAFAQKIVRAVLEQDIDLLQSVVKGDYSDLIVGLIAVVAALKTSRA